MKPFIIGIASALLMVFSYIGNFDYQMNDIYIRKLKYTAAELSASAALITYPSSYSKGKIVFNQQEGTKILEWQMKKLLNLDDSFNPLPNSYWEDTITYQVFFYDDSNTIYPYLFKDTNTYFTQLITSPTVIVKINAGKTPFFLDLFNNEDNIRVASHEWKSK